ncbi:MAG: BMP family ABC transporter substrate-binding protein [Salinibacterium sp.]|nr:MAG: BMP family ABC transporter substrate-binding protein [Salinibacterium sp.]
MSKLISRLAVAAIVAAALTLTGCAPASPVSGLGDAPGLAGTAIGFVLPGAKNDAGYSQAVFEASQELGKDYPELDVLVEENVQDGLPAVSAMEHLIEQGARIIFATGPGQLGAAQQIASEHPEVVVVQQGDSITGQLLPNIGTYGGFVYQPMYLAGIVAGATSKTGKLGFVYEFPTSQTIVEINAFERGAQLAHPNVQTIAVSTASRCDKTAQGKAAARALAEGVDVLAQHQDCPRAVIEAAEAAGVDSVGYGSDASEIAPEGWLTGVEFNWAPLYKRIARNILDGEFTGGEFNANYRFDFRSDTNPVALGGYGDSVKGGTQSLVATAEINLGTAEGSPFAGPLFAQDGTQVLADGEVLSDRQINAMNYFVKGVVGHLAK